MINTINPNRVCFNRIVFTGLLLANLNLGCGPRNNELLYSIEVYQTSQGGDNLKLKSIHQGDSSAINKAVHLNIEPELKYQEIIGFGASFTESSAWNLATIPIKKRQEVLKKLFSVTNGAGFSLTRTHINSCDYSNYHYTYSEVGDTTLSSFSIKEDLRGFTGDENDQVRNILLEDPSYDLAPMILEASRIQSADFKIIASPWSPPSWMKENETAEMTNGSLLPEYYGLWARYLSKYVSSYKKIGINLWGLTPQNEPLHAHDARWDSNGFTPEQARDFLRDYLGPQLVKDGHMNTDNLDQGLRVLIYDHNKSMMNDYVHPTYADTSASKYAWGTAFHWYASSKLKENNYFEKELNALNTNWPTKGMIHTESSIDIDKENPIGQYWIESRDYAGQFVPFDTYVYDIITNLNNGTQGYIEWCMILSHEGKPNPYDNFNSAPVLINPETDEAIYTPLYYLLSHFSKFIRPAAKRISIVGEEQAGLIYTAAENPDGSIAVVVYNKNNEQLDLSLMVESSSFKLNIGPRTLQTIHLIRK